MQWEKFLFLISVSIGLCYDYEDRVDCHPDPDPSQIACQSRTCIWDEPSTGAPVDTPSCFYPKASGYTLQSQGENDFMLKAGTPNPFGSNISPLEVRIQNLKSTLVLTIGGSDRYVPPVDLPRNGVESSDSLVFKSIDNQGFWAFQIQRKSTGTNIWDTSIGGLQFADKFLQISTFLPSRNIFGFGEHIHQKLKHNTTRYTTWPMWSMGMPPDSTLALSTQNLYGTHPFYLVVENDGNAHGVFFFNSNAQEVSIGPSPHLTYRTIGGRLEMAFFPGPKPEDVIHQYLQYIGTPYLPAYWALGFQLCRWGYKDLDAMKKVIERTQKAEIPLDVVIADIDYMDSYRDFTVGEKWSDLPKYTADLHSQGLHLTLIFDPAIEADYATFQRAMENNVSFLEWESASQVPKAIQSQYPMINGTLIMLGNVWPEKNVAFPDFLDPSNSTENWWISEFQRFRNVVPFDGIWIDMNEAQNFLTTATKNSQDATSKLECPYDDVIESLDNPPYKTAAVYHFSIEHPYLFSKTVCLVAKTMRRTNWYFNTKNLYGWSETKATNKALEATTGKRGMIISRSTFPSSGRYGGHWLGDNTARWNDLRTSVISAMEFNFFGIPYVGSDICGFQSVTTEELCLRWQQMGAFHSFSRNHNMKDMPAQDPAVWPAVAAAAKLALEFRYLYLPYLYSLHYASSLEGHTVVRPLFFEFFNDASTMDVDYQFLWGKALMIAPALYPGVSNVEAYFPNDIWYSLYPETYGSVVEPGLQSVPAAKDSLTPVFVRGGHILPRQGSNTTTTASRTNPLQLLVASSNATSTGFLYYDAGDDLVQDLHMHKRHHWSFTFVTNTTEAVLEGLCENCDKTISIPSIDIVEILGYEFYLDYASFQLNGNKVNVNVQLSNFNPFTHRLWLQTVEMIPLKSLVNGPQFFTLTWKHVAM